MSAASIVIMGGSFDPVHQGHIDMARYCCNRFNPSQLRLVPTGNPWQKPPLAATPKQRIDMLRLAFDSTSLPVFIDTQEIDRLGPSYTVDTLSAIRSETDPSVPLIFVMGSDQLHNLHTWHEWQQLFHLAHIAVTTRPGYPSSLPELPDAVRNALESRLATPEEISKTPYGKVWMAENPVIDVSATEIRENIKLSDIHRLSVPPKVLDYIVNNHLYRD